MSKKDCGEIDLVESCAVLEGLVLAWNRGLRYLEVQTDAQRVTDWINKGTSLHGPARDIIQKSKNLLKRDWEVTIKHVYREQNRVTDKLIEIATYQRDAWMFLERPPRDVRQLLLEDKWGASWPRTVPLT